MTASSTKNALVAGVFGGIGRAVAKRLEARQ
jgi:NAD(P)-dependent dehydrogenase (short-subunit alcohol dehydrogenase family)